jgi:hypothetical protein
MIEADACRRRLICLEAPEFGPSVSLRIRTRMPRRSLSAGRAKSCDSGRSPAWRMQSRRGGRRSAQSRADRRRRWSRAERQRAGCGDERNTGLSVHTISSYSQLHRARHFRKENFTLSRRAGAIAVRDAFDNTFDRINARLDDSGAFPYNRLHHSGTTCSTFHASSAEVARTLVFDTSFPRCFSVARKRRSVIVCPLRLIGRVSVRSAEELKAQRSKAPSDKDRQIGQRANAEDSLAMPDL